MKKGLFKSVLSFLITFSLLFGTISCCFSAQVIAAAKEEENVRYVPNEEIIKATADSVMAGYGPEQAFDGNVTDSGGCWHTEMNSSFPHWIMAEFDRPKWIDALICYSRNTQTYPTDYEIWVSPDSSEANLKKVAEGKWSTADAKGNEFTAVFGAVEAKLIKFVIKADSNPDPHSHTSLNEIKYRVNTNVPGAYNSEILTAVSRAENALSYAKEHIGTGAYDYKRAAYDKLSAEKSALEGLLDSADSEKILSAIQSTEDAILALIGSNMAEADSLTADIPITIMSAEANSSNTGYDVSKAIDGNPNSIWHSRWSPVNDEFPHIVTLDLSKYVLLDKISITPRQDADAGKITKGQIYAGDSLDNMKHVTDFTGAAGRKATVVDLNFVAARYVQIVSLAASSANTAIAEIGVSTYDRGLAGAYSAYDYAVDLTNRASAGSEVGEYDQADIDAFKAEVAGFAEQLGGKQLSTKEYYSITEKIKKSCAAFSEKEKAYTKKDLSSLIDRIKAVVGSVADSADKTSAESAISKAEAIIASADAAKEEIQLMANQLISMIGALDAGDKGSCDLSGQWQVALSEYSADLKPSETVRLPGTLDTNKIGTYNGYADISRLSRYYTYTGPATYQKEIYVSKAWTGKSIKLYMERTRETSVLINGTKVPASDSASILPVSQQYDITRYLNYGEYNTISIVVDNSYPSLPADAINNSHMATDETQTNWNGIVGRFELLIDQPVFIDDLRVYPNDDLKSVTAKIDVKNNSGAAYSGTLTLKVAGASDRKIDVSVAAGKSSTVQLADFAMPADVKLWSEFETPLYKMTAALDTGSAASENFGMRVFKANADGTKFSINGYDVFLRNEANCAVFPLTGYAPMDEAGWEKLFGAYKSYGINAVRFHSWCPPEAAFDVADRLGLYLQPELSCWAGNMLGDNVRQTYFTKEAIGILKEYANHPSFTMVTFGNELSYTDAGYAYAEKLIGQMKAYDSTRMYAAGSNINFGSQNPTANADFFTAQSYFNEAIRGSFGGLTGFVNNQYPSSNVKFDSVSDKLAALHVPAFSFEVGQYQVFPDVLTEADRYTGVLDARNLQTVKDRLEAKGITDEEVEAAINASGMLSRLCYRAEIEAALRTEALSGISLLGIQDFSGQGTALVGMVNAFGESKPYDFADPEEFSKFFSPTTVLFETDKFCYTNSEKLTGNLLFSNYAQSNLTGEIKYTLTSDDGKVVAEGKTKRANLRQGKLTDAGKISIDLGSITEPTRLTLEISCLEAENSYNIWVYPDKKAVADGEVYVAEYLDNTALEILSEGGKVFLSPKADKSVLPDTVEGRFSTAFWSTNDTTQPSTMGLLMDPEHPLFEQFPTDYYSDYQWWTMARYGRPMVLESLTGENGERIEPLVKVLDCGFLNLNNMGLLYEAKVGAGKLVVSSMGLEQLKYEYPEAMALRNAIISYMNTDAFNPQFEVDVKAVQEQVLKPEGDERVNLASKYSGGKPFTAGKTETCQGGYDRDPVDRIVEINDGIVDISSSSRSWTDYRGDQIYNYDVEIGVELADSYTVDTVAFSFFEDQGCKAPAEITVMYWNGSEYVPVSGQSAVNGFVTGMNTITFDAVRTEKLKFVMVHTGQMAVAISEMFVYEKQVDPEKITVMSQDGRDEITLTETLQMYIETEPEYANNRLVRWSVVDASGKASGLAEIGFDGVLKPKAAGTVYVRAELRSDAGIYSVKEIRIVERTALAGDIDGNGVVNVADIIQLKALIMQNKWTDEQLAAGDMDGNGTLNVGDMLAVKNVIMSGK